jgi:ribose transport system ATP-binding protein
MGPNSQLCLELDGITKSFGSSTALAGVHFELLVGEVHALLGANGAGKSTLVKIIAGALKPDEGSIRIHGKGVSLKTPGEARKAGISYVAQDPALVDSLSVAENLFLGKEILNRFQLLDKSEMFKMAAVTMGEIGFPLDVTKLVRDLGAAEKQLVEIGKSILENNKILILDEPTSALTREEAVKLFTIIKSLKSKGLGIVYITHHLDEIKEIGDRVTVLRDGRNAGNFAASADSNEIVSAIMGRQVADEKRSNSSSSKEVAFEVKQLSVKGVIENCDCKVHKGEIIAFFGLAGSGRAELFLTLNGSLKADTGSIEVKGKQIPHNEISPRTLINHGVFCVPADRKKRGVIGTRSVKENVALSNLSKHVKRGLINRGSIEEKVNALIQDLSIKVASNEQNIKQLSGGNQQKVLLGRALFSESSIFLIDDPTVGIDIGARAQVHHIMFQMVERGNSIVIGSSDVKEACHIADRLYVVHRGHIVAELERDNLNEEYVMGLASGVTMTGGSYANPNI